MDEQTARDDYPPSPQQQGLPEGLVRAVTEAVRRVGLPLAAETGDAGVVLVRADGPLLAPEPADHVGVTWHVPNALYDEAEAEPEGGPSPVRGLLSTTDRAMDSALTAILTAAGLLVAPHPTTGIVAVWASRTPSG